MSTPIDTVIAIAEVNGHSLEPVLVCDYGVPWPAYKCRGCKRVLIEKNPTSWQLHKAILSECKQAGLRATPNGWTLTLLRDMDFEAIAMGSYKVVVREITSS